MADFKCFLFVLLLYLFNSVDSSSLCNESFCREYIHDPGCPATAIHCGVNNATHSGMTMPSPTICNCCNFCLPLFGKGEHCSLGGPGAGTTVGRCGDSLTCAEVTSDDDDDTVCVKMTSDCFKKQAEFDAREANGEVGALEVRPTCDGKGKFAPLECVPAHTCFCQSEDGERIYGETLNLGPTTLRHTQCGCSRFHEKIKKNLSPAVPAPIVGPRCTIDGNFNPIQCINRTCYCVNPITGIVIDQIPSIDLERHPITELDCYNPNLDAFPEQSEGEAPYNYTTDCIEQRERVVKIALESEKEGYNIDFGGGFPECYPDGSFGRFGHTRTQAKICIDHHGRRIGDFEAASGTDAYEEMDCKCAMTSFLMGASTEKPVCCKNGNFRKIQCRRGLCRCVDSDGRQTTLETSNPSELPCLTLNWMTC